MTDEAFKTAADKVRALEEGPRARLLGLSEGEAKLNGDKAVSKLTQKRIIGAAIRGEDEQADAMFKAAIEKGGGLLEEDADETQRRLQAQTQHNATYARSIQRYNDTQRKNKIEGDIGQIAARNITTDPSNGQPIINPNIFRELTAYGETNPRAYKQTQQQINWAEHQLDLQAKGVRIKTDPNTLSGLTKNMFDSTRPTTLQDIDASEMNDQLSHSDGVRLRAIVKDRDGGDHRALSDPLFKVVSNWAKLTIEGTSARERQANADQYTGFQQQFLREYLKRVREGKLEPGDLDVNNPDSMVRKIADQWRPQIGETVRDNGGVGAPPAPAPTGPAPIQIKTKEEFDALAPNTPYTRPDRPGETFRKPAKPAKPEKPEARM
jgi:hypothetical protein